ncbi:MAG: hypothetical protein H3C30_07350 [Candidatus Hydrogenedentes bacterium]|nr:hypothetical protein [Candidatus Hydrogenedentota bacterium]
MNINIKDFKTCSIIALFVGIFLIACQASADDAAVAVCVEKFLSVIEEDIYVTTVESSKTIYTTPIGLPYRRVKVNSSYTILISNDNSIIYGFVRNGAFTDRAAKGKQKNSIISEDEAFKIVKNVISIINVSLNKDDFTIRFNDTSIVNKDGSSEPFWSFVSEQKFNDIPCRKRTVNFEIAADNGELLLYRYRPIVIPTKDLMINIKREDAITIAAEWVSKEPYLVRYNGVLSPVKGEGVLVIAPEGNPYKLDSDDLQKQVEVKTYYCWEEEFRWIENESKGEGVVWIDVNDGHIVGAN